MTDFQNRVLECAIAYAAKGWRVLPLHSVNDGVCTCGKTDCPSPGKHPVTRNGVKDATIDEDTIVKWFGDGRALNVGICAGKESGLVVLDVDPAHGGDASAQRLNVPATLEVTTGSGGRHYYFAYPKEGGVKNSVGKVGPGLDVRSDAGYVVAPPSLHVCGNEYRWKVNPRAMLPAACPGWLLKGKAEASDQTLSGLDQREPIPQGLRNCTLTSIAGAMRRQGCDAETIGETLISVNRRRCQPPLEYAELKKIAESISRYEPEPKTGGLGQILLDNGHALTIARTIRDSFQQDDRILRHYNYQGTWCEFTGCGYEITDYLDMQNAVWRFATRCLVPGRGEEAVPVPLNCTEHVVKNALSAMGSFEGVDIRSSIVAPAWLDGAKWPVDSAQGGPDPEYVIALKNGLLDVSGEPVLIEHTPDFLNFNLLPYDYDAGAECPAWIAFLGQVFGKEGLSSTETRWDEEKSDFVEVEETVPDSEKIECLQEWFGLLLTTEMKYHKMLGVIGPKRSGKGTIARVLTAMIGSSNVATPTFASLVESFGLQGLLNARVAIFGDANMDKDPVVVSRAVEKLKTISGGDGVDVNRKYEKVIQGARLGVRFVMISNNLQRLTDPTGTISDRFIFLKTTQSFYGREDLGLEARLLAELPGILNWSLVGLGRLNERGSILEPNESIEMRTQSKELGSNVIAFVNSACNTGQELYTLPDDMYDAFKRWCEVDGSKPMKKRAFRQELNEAFGEHACSKHRVPEHDNPTWVYWNIEPHLAYRY